MPVNRVPWPGCSVPGNGATELRMTGGEKLGSGPGAGSDAATTCASPRLRLPDVAVEVLAIDERQDLDLVLPLPSPVEQPHVGGDPDAVVARKALQRQRPQAGVAVVLGEQVRLLEGGALDAQVPALERVVELAGEVGPQPGRRGLLGLLRRGLGRAGAGPAAARPRASACASAAASVRLARRPAAPAATPAPSPCPRGPASCPGPAAPRLPRRWPAPRPAPPRRAPGPRSPPRRPLAPARPRRPPGPRGPAPRGATSCSFSRCSSALRRAASAALLGARQLLLQLAGARQRPRLSVVASRPRAAPPAAPRRGA